MIHRFSPGELIRTSRKHQVWSDYFISNHTSLYVERHTSQYIDKYEFAIFIQFGGIEYDKITGDGWVRNLWKLKVLSHSLGIVWVVDEYMEGA